MPSLDAFKWRVLRAVSGKGIPKLNSKLAEMERIFRSPPLTTELVAAIKLISPQLNLMPTEAHRSFWEADQNGACWGEYEALASVFQAMPKPIKILEIGPGMGRSLIFFCKKLGWEDSEIHAFEGDGNTTKYTILGRRFEDSYCGNISALRHVLEFNGIENVKIFSAQDVQLKDLAGPYDLLYSFYSIGFHWSLEHFLDDLLPLIHDRSIALFTVPQQFKAFPRLETLCHRIVECETTWDKKRKLKLLVLSKQPLADWT